MKQTQHLSPNEAVIYVGERLWIATKLNVDENSSTRTEQRRLSRTVSDVRNHKILIYSGRRQTSTKDQINGIGNTVVKRTMRRTMKASSAHEEIKERSTLEISTIDWQCKTKKKGCEDQQESYVQLYSK